MKLLRFGIRFCITITSLISFRTGWILLAHAPKPISTSSSLNSNSVATLPTLEPLRSSSDFQTGDDNSQNAPTFNFQPRNAFRPAFTTGGS
jgi:hypothetical protein